MIRITYVIKKQDINRIQSIHVEQPPSKVGKVLQNIGTLLNANSCEQNKTPTKKKRTTKKELRNTIKVSTKLNSIYEQTWVEKKLL